MKRRQEGIYFSLTPQPESLAHYSNILGTNTTNALEGLARLVSSNGGWPYGFKGYLILRKASSPSIGLLVFDCSEQKTLTWLRNQRMALQQACTTLLYASGTKVDKLTEILAYRLAACYGRKMIEQARFIAIPHGGSIVLNLLASTLGLKDEQLETTPTLEELVIVVDDCAISGLRFKQFLDGCASRRIVFAHLYSHPALRAAIEAREPRVLACVSAEDLREVAQSVPPEHEQRRRERIERGECYWIGSTEALCFPWNEPDRSFWNPITGRQERAWKIVPTEFCSKNHPAPGTTPIPIQIQPEGRGPLRPSQRAVFGELDGALVVCDMETGQCFGLEGVAADLWRALLVHGHPEAVADALQAGYDVAGEVFREDTRNFFEDLEARGLIEWTESD